MDTVLAVVTALAVFVAGYLIGSIPFSIIIGRLHGIDIRKEGSHNAGGTNVGRVVGKKWGIITILLDILKCYIPCLVVFLVLELVSPSFLLLYSHMTELCVSITAFGVCIGHTLPLYAGFKGGKCVACFAGYIIFISPVVFALACSVFFALFFWKKKVSLSSVIAVPTALLLLLVPMILDLTVLNGEHTYNGGAMYGPGLLIQISYVTVITTFVLASLVIIRHMSNIKRLEKGEEPETHFKHND